MTSSFIVFFVINYGSKRGRKIPEAQKKMSFKIKTKICVLRENETTFHSSQYVKKVKNYRIEYSLQHRT